MKEELAKDPKFLNAMEAAALMLKSCLAEGGTIYACGNGGSACDAMHFTEELVARYKKERPGMRARHFLDPGILTCWANDYDYTSVFERQALTFCSPKDVLLAISTSGESENVLRAVQAAKKLGSKTLGLIGRDGGNLGPACDLALVVPVQETERIQEAHITIIHILCELLES
ncbi:MAG: phosphoheptose isomerase [Proteobacteria bacterium]|nr:MAG: phosphoheptose isomerase [Pseudomonadota bacterium]